MNDCVLTYKDCLCESVLYPSRNTLYSFISYRSINCLFAYSFIHSSHNKQSTISQRSIYQYKNECAASKLRRSIHLLRKTKFTTTDHETKQSNPIPSNPIPLTNDFSLLLVLFNDREQFRVSYESAQKLGSLSKQQHRRSPHVWLIRQNAKDDTSQ